MDPDPDPTYHFDAVPYQDSAYHCDAYPDPAYHFDVDPDPAFQFDADPDPYAKSNNLVKSKKTLVNVKE